MEDEEETGGERKLMEVNQSSIDPQRMSIIIFPFLVNGTGFSILCINFCHFLKNMKRIETKWRELEVVAFLYNYLVKVL